MSSSAVLVISALWPLPPSAEAFGIDANLSYPDFTIGLQPFVDRQGGFSLFGDEMNK